MIQIHFTRLITAFLVGIFILIPLIIILQEYGVHEIVSYLVCAVYIVYVTKSITTPPYIPDAKIDALRENMRRITQQLKYLSKLKQNGEGDFIALTVAALVLMRDMAYRNMQEEAYTATQQAIRKLNKDAAKYAKRNERILDTLWKKAPLSTATKAAVAITIYGAFPDAEHKSHIEEATGSMVVLSISMAEQILMAPLDEQKVKTLATLVHHLEIFDTYLGDADEALRQKVKQHTAEKLCNMSTKIHAFSAEIYRQLPLLQTSASELLAYAEKNA